MRYHNMHTRSYPNRFSSALMNGRSQMACIYGQHPHKRYRYKFQYIAHDEKMSERKGKPTLYFESRNWMS